MNVHTKKQEKVASILRKVESTHYWATEQIKTHYIMSFTEKKTEANLKKNVARKLSSVKTAG